MKPGIRANITLFMQFKVAQLARLHASDVNLPAKPPTLLKCIGVAFSCYILNQIEYGVPIRGPMYFNQNMALVRSTIGYE